jgi:N-acetylglucosaminyldiphosphoundecaprenol N-acetyl-beta-D-mannosaminyltransferase
VIHSELSIADGMPIVWMAKLLGVPITARVAGSSLVDVLDRTGGLNAKLKVYFFGGPDGVAEAACAALNARNSGLECVGFQSPGFVSVSEMSAQSRIDAINSCAPDFVIVALGAKKGQEWIELNRSKIDAPVISHLGAVVNFVAGSVARAPLWMQRTGLEWLWRIMEEPALWNRYWRDGLGLLELLLINLLPHAVWRLSHRSLIGRGGKVSFIESDSVCQISVTGSCGDLIIESLRSSFKNVAKARKKCLIDVSRAEYLGAGFFGLILMLKKYQDIHGLELSVVGVRAKMRYFFQWNGVEYLLD